MQKYAYWGSTALLALMMLGGGVFDILQPDDFKASVAGLGYPLQFFKLIGVWKIAGSIAILAPRLPRLKEWAYAGFFFDTTGALATHTWVGDDFEKMIPAILGVVLTYASWRLRPGDRRI